jgi:hypothetical protein
MFHYPEVYQCFLPLMERIPQLPADGVLGWTFGQLSYALDKPLIVLMDEIDSLVGDTLISVLRQLRSGYINRPKAFPQSVILCGLRDVRDYRIHSDKDKAIITGGSAFNIKAESLRLGDFSVDDIKTLYLQHTIETGQVFEPDVFPYVWELTEGQPWLVNALAYESCFKLEKDRTKPISRSLIEQSKENMILRRDTHIDILIDKLREDRVKSVIQPMLMSEDLPDNIPEADILYVADMGLIKRKGNWVISNAIYKEVIPRELIWSTQTMMVQEIAWYTENGKLRMDKLLEKFQEFFRENSEIWLERFAYKEAGPHLLLMAFLQRVINGGGKIFREYGLGMKRMDLLIEYAGDRFALELKVVSPRHSKKQALLEGIPQLKMYRDKSGAKEGHLIVFNRKPDVLWADKLYREIAGEDITVWGM